MKRYCPLVHCRRNCKKKGESIFWTKLSPLRHICFAILQQVIITGIENKYLHFWNNDAQDPQNLPDPNLYNIWTVFAYQ